MAQPLEKYSQQGQAVILSRLLDENQPYSRFHSLDDPELTKFSTYSDPIIKRIKGSLVGLAVGDAVGAPVEFRPHSFLKENPVKDMQSGGTWGLKKGQWTDDTSMTLCLAASLIVRGTFDPLDQFLRYKKWYRNGYMSCTGKCFDIGKSTRESIEKFEAVYDAQINRESPENVREYFHRAPNKLECGENDAAGNGSLMRVAPIPLFFFNSYEDLRKYIVTSTRLTHGDKRAVDASLFFASLIWHALNGSTKEELLDKHFSKHLGLELTDEVLKIAEGSYKTKKGGYDDGIRGKGFVLNSLEAVLWAFENDNNSFEQGVLKVINLGDDTDTTAAIYGQLAGAVYGIDQIPQHWRDALFKREFIEALATGLYMRRTQTSSKTNVSPNMYHEQPTEKDNLKEKSQNGKKADRQKNTEAQTGKQFAFSDQCPNNSYENSDQKYVDVIRIKRNDLISES